MKAIIWGVMVSLGAVYLASAIAQGDRLQTDLFSLLPDTKSESGVRRSVNQVTSRLSQRVNFLIGSKQFERSQEVSAQLHQILQNSGLFDKLTYRVSQQLSAQLVKSYEPFRPGLMTEDDYLKLSNSNYHWLTERIIYALSSPVSMANSTNLQQDPFQFYGRYLQSLPNLNLNANLSHGLLYFLHNEKYYVLISGILKGSAFEQNVQQQFDGMLKSFEQQLPNADDIELIASGIIRHASASRDIAQSEMSLISSISLAGILTLMLVYFRSIVPFIYVLIPIAVGIIMGGCVCLLIFQKVHILTVVFGSSLIGISVDYSLHYCANYSSLNRYDSSARALKNIMPALTLGLLSSILAFLTLFITRFPALQQMAVLAASGLLSAYLCVILWYPQLIKNPLKIRRAATMMTVSIPIRLQNSNHLPNWVLVGCLVLLVALVVLIKSPKDDINLLRTPIEGLSKMDNALSVITGTQLSSQFFLVSSSSVENLQLIERKLTLTLSEYKQQNRLSDFSAITRMLPSRQQQIKNYKLIRRKLIEENSLQEAFQAAGLPSELLQSYRMLYQKEHHTGMGLLSFLQTDFARPIRDMWLGEIDGKYYSVVTLFGVKNADDFRAIAKQMDDVFLIDQTYQVSTLLAEYRREIESILPWVVLILALLFMTRFKPATAVRVLLAPTIAASLSFVSVLLLEGQYNLFHLFGVIIAIGIAIDYSLFVNAQGSHQSSTYLALTLSGLTTMLAFGLLALSKTPALHAFGLSLMLGILFAYAITPVIVNSPLVEGRQAS